MKETIRLELPTPCHENWDAMTPTEQGRHCGSCCKTVVDFTMMTDREIVDYMSFYASGNTCGRLNDNQLNRLIQTPPERKPSRKYFWSLALTSLLLTYRSLVQAKPVKVKAATTAVSDTTKPIVHVRLGQVMVKHPVDTILMEVNGRVVNDAGEPVPFASVVIPATHLSLVADSAGHYSYRVSADQFGTVEITISAAGYESLPPARINVQSIQSLDVVKDKRLIKVFMKDVVLQKKTLQEVVVRGYGTTRCISLTGSVVAWSRVTKYEKVKQKVAALYRSDIKIYPNPAPASGTFNLQFNLKQAGEYNVQFIDAAGRIVGGKRVMISSPGQTEIFTGNQLPGCGAYFVRVAGRNDGKIYNAKLVVQ